MLQAYLPLGLQQNNCHIPFGHEEDLTNRHEQTRTLNSIDSLCFKLDFKHKANQNMFFFLLMGYLCLFLPHGLTNEYIISIFMF